MVGINERPPEVVAIVAWQYDCNLHRGHVRGDWDPPGPRTACPQHKVLLEYEPAAAERFVANG